MKRQSKLVRLSAELATWINKGRSYPYASERQRERWARQGEREAQRAVARVRETNANG